MLSKTVMKQLPPPSVTSGAGFGANVKDCVALVTGSSGLCGARLVEMLIERGAKKVIGIDICEPNDSIKERFQQTGGGDKISLLTGHNHGDITNVTQLESAFSTNNVTIVYHIAALVGPFHDRDKYYAVNYEATVSLLDLCKKYNVKRFVYSSSPSTRFTGHDIKGLREDQLEIPKTFLALYAETKAYGEIKVKEYNDPPNLYTIIVAPHQVYGPYDNLFLPNLLSTMGNDRLRIFGKGDKLISTCYVDNYCHGLMCGADALIDNHIALSKFYIITDDEPQNFWEMINQAGLAMGFTDLYTKFHLPIWVLYGVAYICNVIGFMMNKKLKLNPFNVNMSTIHRYFNIMNSKKDLQYQPLYQHNIAWEYTIHWFYIHWLPKFLNNEKKSGTTPVEKKEE